MSASQPTLSPESKRKRTMEMEKCNHCEMEECVCDRRCGDCELLNHCESCGYPEIQRLERHLMELQRLVTQLRSENEELKGENEDFKRAAAAAQIKEDCAAKKHESDGKPPDESRVYLGSKFRTYIQKYLHCKHCGADFPANTMPRRGSPPSSDDEKI